MSVTEDLLDMLCELMLATEQLHKMSVTTDAATRSMTLTFEGLDEEWLREVTDAAAGLGRRRSRGTRDDGHRVIAGLVADVVNSEITTALSLRYPDEVIDDALAIAIGQRVADLLITGSIERLFAAADAYRLINGR